MTFLKVIGGILTGLVMTVGGFFSHQSAPAPLAGSFTPVGGSTYTLSGAGINSTATSIQLNSFKTPDGRNLTMGMFGSIGYAVIDPNSPSRIEDITFTGITQNSNGSATLTGVSRGMDFVTPYTASTTLAQSHSGGSYLILSNTAGFYGQQFALVNSVASVSAVWTFSSTSQPGYDANPATWTSPNSFINKAYADALSIQGAATSTFANMGISQLATQAQVGAATASSTEGRPLVLSATYSTSTCQTTGYNVLVASSTTGKLNGNCLDTTSNAYTWTKKQTFSATTSIAASSTTTAPLTLNGINYSFPPADASASSSVLGSDTHGDLTWQSGHARYVAFNVSGASQSNGYSTTTLITIPANFLNASSTIEVRASGSCSVVGVTSGGTCTFYLRDANGATFDSFTANSQANNSSNDTGPTSGTFSFMVIPTASMSAQETIHDCNLSSHDSSPLFVMGGCRSGGGTASTINLANSVTIDLVIRGADANETAAFSGLTITVQQ